MLVLPITLLLIYVILYSMFQSPKWALLVLGNVALAPFGGFLALLITGEHISVSSGVGFSGSFWSVRADRRHHGGIHQSLARRRQLD